MKIFYKEKLTIPYSNSEIKNRIELHDLRNSYKDLEVELERNKESNNLEKESNKENKNLEVELERNESII